MNNKRFEYMTRLVVPVIANSEEDESTFRFAKQKKLYTGREQTLADLGSIGWELVQIVPVENDFLALFKREL